MLQEVLATGIKINTLDRRAIERSNWARKEELIKVHASGLKRRDKRSNDAAGTETFRDYINTCIMYIAFQGGENQNNHSTQQQYNKYIAKCWSRWDGHARTLRHQNLHFTSAVVDIRLALDAIPFFLFLFFLLQEILRLFSSWLFLISLQPLSQSGIRKPNTNNPQVTSLTGRAYNYENPKINRDQSTYASKTILIDHSF